MPAEKRVKYILVTGGVISGVGKGIISSSLGVLLKNNGYKVGGRRNFTENSRGIGKSKRVDRGLLRNPRKIFLLKMIQ